MVYQIYQILLISSVITLLLAAKSTTGHKNKDEAMLQKFQELTIRLDEILEKNMENDVKIAFLETTNAKSNIQMDHLEAENADSKIRIGKLEAKIFRLEKNSSEKSTKMVLLEKTNVEQDKEISKLKTKLVSKPVAPISPGFSKKEMPSSCSELGNMGHSADGIYLVKNPGTKKIETVFCTLGTTLSQKLIGNIDVKTKSVLFNVVRKSIFSTKSAIIPFELARLNEGGAMDLASGIFTAPVSGIYQFEFSGIKDREAGYVSIFIVVNGSPQSPKESHVGTAYSGQYAKGTHDSVSFTTLIRLKVNDRVNLVNDHDGILYDNLKSHHTQFIGMLVQEDLI